MPIYLSDGTESRGPLNMERGTAFWVCLGLILLNGLAIAVATWAAGA